MSFPFPVDSQCRPTLAGFTIIIIIIIIIITIIKTTRHPPCLSCHISYNPMCFFRNSLAKVPNDQKVVVDHENHHQRRNHPPLEGSNGSMGRWRAPASWQFPPHPTCKDSDKRMPQTKRSSCLGGETPLEALTILNVYYLFYMTHPCTCLISHPNKRDDLAALQNKFLHEKNWTSQKPLCSRGPLSEMCAVTHRELTDLGVSFG